MLSLLIENKAVLDRRPDLAGESTKLRRPRTNHRPDCEAKKPVYQTPRQTAPTRRWGIRQNAQRLFRPQDGFPKEHATPLDHQTEAPPGKRLVETGRAQSCEAVGYSG